MVFNNVYQIQKYLDNFVKLDSKKIYKGDWGLFGVKKLLELLGNPQEKYQIFHVAGTSGKGSTSIFLSHILESQGFKTGLTVSPYILDFKEEFTINNQLPNEDSLCIAFNEFVNISNPLLLELDLSYHEILICFVYYFFYMQKVQVAIIEVFMGGLFDSTNVIKNPNKICVINDIGYDHTQILGTKITQIAKQKAGIIQPNNTVVILQQSYKTAQKEILKKALGLNLKSINIVKYDISIKNSESKKINSFNYLVENKDNLFQIQIYKQKTKILSTKFKIFGKFQEKNLALALTASFLYLKKLNISLETNKLEKALTIISIKGRFDVQKILFKKKIKTLIFDGAHNPQKFLALVESLNLYFPNKKFYFLLAFKETKDIQKILKILKPIGFEFYFTEFSFQNQFQNISKFIQPLKKDEIEKCCKKLKLKNTCFLTQKDLLKRVYLNNLDDQNVLVISGSIYFISQMYKILEGSLSKHG